MSEIVLSLLCAAPLFSVVYLFFLTNKRALLSRKRVWLAFPLSQLIAVLIMLSYGFDAELGPLYFCLTFVGCLLCVLVDLFLLLTLALTAGDALTGERLRRLRDQVRLQKAYNRKYLKNLEEAREVKRSIVGIFEKVAEAAGDSESLQEEFAKLNMTAKAAHAQKVCDHPVVDAILGLKLEECESKGIEMGCRVVIPSRLDIPDVDLCAVFSNLIDNAMNACELMRAGCRFIDVRSRVAAGRLVVEVVNTCPDKGFMDEYSALRDSGANSDFPEHGWGFTILRNIAWNNDGSFETAIEHREDLGRVFRATVILGLGGGEWSSSSSVNELPRGFEV